MRYGLVKTAEVVTDLLPHQQRAIEKLRNQPGLVLAHGLGSGKTLSALAAADDIGGKADFLVPASLADNLAKEEKKHIRRPMFRRFMDTLQRTGLHRGENLLGGDLLVVDEAHRLREPGVTQRAVKEKARDYDKRLLLTATPIYNRPSDIAPLVNIAAGTKILPEGKEFDARYLRDVQVNPGFFRRLRGVTPGTRRELQRKGELQDALNKWVDYHENPQEGFPERIDRTVEVTMDPLQYATYRGLDKNAPVWMRTKVRAGLPPQKAEAAQLNAFLSGLRQTSLSEYGFVEGLTPEQAADRSAKIQRAANSLKEQIAADPNFRGVVYSNYLDTGLKPYSTVLEREGIPYGMFTGQVSKKERDQMVRDYNEGKIKALLVSSAGGEGLDLKGTKTIQVLEPHWNDPKVDQVIGRGIRFGSHAHLPEDERKVVVERFVSKMPLNPITKVRRAWHELLQTPRRTEDRTPWRGPLSADAYLMDMSAEKTRINDQMRDILRAGAEKTSSEDADRSFNWRRAATIGGGLAVGAAGGALLGRTLGRRAGSSLGRRAASRFQGPGSAHAEVKSLLEEGVNRSRANADRAAEAVRRHHDPSRHLRLADGGRYSPGPELQRLHDAQFMSNARLARAEAHLAEHLEHSRQVAEKIVGRYARDVSSIGTITGGLAGAAGGTAVASEVLNRREKNSAREEYLEVDGKRVPFSQYFGSDNAEEVLLHREMRDILLQAKKRPTQAVRAYNKLRKDYKEMPQNHLGIHGVMAGVSGLGSLGYVLPAGGLASIPAALPAAAALGVGTGMAFTDELLDNHAKAAKKVGERGYKARAEIAELQDRLVSLPKGTPENEEARGILLRDIDRKRRDLDTIYSDERAETWDVKPARIGWKTVVPMLAGLAVGGGAAIAYGLHHRNRGRAIADQIARLGSQVEDLYSAARSGSRDSSISALRNQIDELIPKMTTHRQAFFKTPVRAIIGGVGGTGIGLGAGSYPSIQENRRSLSRIIDGIDSELTE